MKAIGYNLLNTFKYKHFMLKRSKTGYVIGLLNPQGHVRWKDLQIAAHPDTGGQIVYINEVAKELGKLGCMVDIFTRYFSDPEWPGYDKLVEKFNDNIRIVRIKCGPEDKFVRKEELWPIIGEFVGGIEEFYRKNRYKPRVFTSHYADAGLAAAMLKNKMKIPFIHTGHSLGGKKMDNLRLTKSNFSYYNGMYKFHLRVLAERISFRNSSAIIASTREEVDKQYGHKVYIGAVREKSKFNIIPPGINSNQFFPYTKKEKKAKEYETAVGALKGELKKSIRPNRLDLPCIFSAARFDAKKNPAGLVRAFAGSEILQQNTNLLIVAGKVTDSLNPDNRSKFSEDALVIIDDLTKLIEKFHLKGKVCITAGFNYISQLPYIYRYAGRNNWIFVNPALHEPFGLTILEAMASGVPVVATKHGGTAEILDAEEYGLLIEPTDWHSIRGGLEKMLLVRYWKKYSRLGIERIKERYTWQIAAKGRVGVIEKVLDGKSADEKDFAIPDYFLNPERENDHIILKEFRRRYYIGGE
jgi:sucrose-phosphate synthase